MEQLDKIHQRHKIIPFIKEKNQISFSPQIGKEIYNYIYEIRNQTYNKKCE